MILFFLFTLFASTHAAYNISVYGDVHKDVEFFTRTFPWIIDNIGGEIIVNYFMLGSGRYSVSQMCALKNLTWNTFLQAQYLKCEAEGKPSAYCLCEAGIDPSTFKQCVRLGGSLAAAASERFTLLGINFTPIIELERGSTVFGVEDIWFLMKICTLFGDNLPRGCIHYSNQTDSFPEKKALAQFDRACHKEFPVSGDDDKPVTPTTTELPPWWLTTTSTPTPWQTTPWWQTTSTPTPWQTTPWWQTTSAQTPWQTTPWWQTTSTPTPWQTTPWWQTTSTPTPWQTTPWWQTTSTPTPWQTTPWWQTTSAQTSWQTTPRWQTMSSPTPNWKTSDWYTTRNPEPTSPSPDWETTSAPFA